MNDLNLIDKINEVVKDIWQNEIKSDYENDYFYNEDTLKNSIYFHLRSKLSDFLIKNNLRIYTEYTLKDFNSMKLRPDIVITKIDDTKNEEKLVNYIDDNCLCVFEIKFISGFSANKVVYNDYDKIKNYIKTIKNDCKYYMATIWEYEDERVPWIDSNEKWAENRLVELNASYENDEIRFYVSDHKHYKT